MDISALANELYENSRAKGFYDHEDRLRQQVEDAGEVAHKLRVPLAGHAGFVRTQLTEHFGNRLMLIAGEAVEAHEELRSGRKVDELYFSGDSDGAETRWPVQSEDQQTLTKPEGVLMELVDVGVRTLETIAGILAHMSPEDSATLRSQVPESEATRYPVGDDDPLNVNVAELFVLKANYNAQRAAMHGRKF